MTSNVGLPPESIPSGGQIVALLTSHNRRELTLRSLEALALSAREAGVQLAAVLVDDASPDGTAEAVRARHPWVHVIEGGGNLFWCRGMHEAMQHGLAMAADHLLWLNDDTILVPGALRDLLSQMRSLTAQHGRPVLLVGATSGPDGRLSYGGARAVSRWRRFQYRKVWQADMPVPCEVVNGNCVLVPMPLARAVGNLDAHFEHAMGDTDYALRTRQAGFPVYAAAGIVGACSTNPRAGSFEDRSLPLRQRWAAIMHRKGLPWRSWLRFTRRHGGVLWPLYFGWPYLRLVLSALRPRPRSSQS